VNAFLRTVAWVAVIAAAICAIIYYTYADVWVVPLDDPRLLVSVEPTLRGGDIVLVERHGAPDLGKLARCTDPDEPRRFVVGRLVGTGGSTVTILDQRFSTPGSREQSNTACGEQTLVNPASGGEVKLRCANREFAGLEYQTLMNPSEYGRDERSVELHIPLEKAYLLSDDRYLHLDSRDFGLVPSASCRHIFFRLWGAEGFGDGSRRFNIVW
jgi:signal peptidase I